MSAKHFICVIPYLAFTSLYLRLRNIPQRIRLILNCLLIAILLLAIWASRDDCGRSWPEEFTYGGERLLRGIASAVIFLFGGICCVIDFAGNYPLAAAVILTELVILLVVLIAVRYPPNQIWPPRVRKLALILLCTVLVALTFLLLYPILTPDHKETNSFSSLIRIIIEHMIIAGSDITTFVNGNIVAARVILPIAAVFLTILLIVRRARNPFSYLLLSAATAALLAQSFIITGDFPQAIYLYLAAGLILAAGRLYRPAEPVARSDHRGRAVIALSLIITASISLGLYRLEAYPVRYHANEAGAGRCLLERAVDWEPVSSWREAIAQNREDPAADFVWSTLLFSADTDSQTPISSHLAYLCLRIFPINYVTLRASVVLTGALSVLFFYLTIRLMFGTCPAILAALFLATGSWFLAINRLHMSHSVTFLYVLICLYLFWKAQQSDSLFRYFLLAVALAFSSPFYATFKMLFLLLPAFCLLQIFLRRGYIIQHLPGFLLVLLTLFLILKAKGLDPLHQFVFYQQAAGQPRLGAETVFQHKDYLSVTETLLEGGRLSALAIRELTKRIFDPSLFSLRRRNYIERGMQFNTFLIPFSLLGFAWCLLNFKTKQCSFLIFWLVFSILPDVLTGRGVIDRRAVLIIAPLMAAAAVGLYTVWTGIFAPLLTGIKLSKFISTLVAISLGLVIIATSSANYFYAYYCREHTPTYPLRDARELKESDLFLETVFDNPYTIYFLDDRTRPYLPQHEVRHFAELRLFSWRNGRIARRSHQINSRQAVDRGILRYTGSKEGFVVIGPGEEKEFIASLQSLHPRSKLFIYRHGRQKQFEIFALVVESRGQEADPEPAE